MAESTPTTSNSEDGQIHGYNNSDVSYRISSPSHNTLALCTYLFCMVHTPICGFSLAYPCQGGSNDTVTIPTILLLLPKQTKLELNKGLANIIPTLMLKALYQI